MCCILSGGGILILYRGYKEANLTIADNEDMLFLVILDHEYGERVPAQMGTWVVVLLVLTMTKTELQ